ncbi:hypothetical protein E6C50_00830 [Flavobacterium supellecticarium]|uniref:Uncharacterized protein n=1 Tax=Flavobacterium supellecticarium TaxID=2565924 RepID=A0A4S4A2Z9_9FLAO|nr:hypothetical protein [Flavobacterium supellecticarium]THF52789.1 hypothetical protein E6C50_00830 [Flavobacterium supellecticarium]
MKKLAIFQTIVMMFLTSCDSRNVKSVEKEITQKPEYMQNENLEILKLEASRLRAGGSVKEVVLNKSSAHITYAKNYMEYKELNPQSTLTEADLAAYWESGNAIDKALVEGGVMIMKKLNFIDSVTITLPYKRELYEVNVTKSEIESFTGDDFPSIIAEWDQKFIDRYVYDKKNREKFLKKFGTVKKIEPLRCGGY